MRAARDRAGQQPGPARARWCDGLPDVTARIECDGYEHRITWRRGKVVLEDHDVLAERSLVALGGEAPTCLEVLDAWRRRRAIGLFASLLLREHEIPSEELAYRRRRYESHLQATRETTARMRAAFGPWQRSMHERERRLWALTLTEALPAAMRRALALSVLVTIERNWEDEEYDAHRRRAESLLAGTATPLRRRCSRGARTVPGRCSGAEPAGRQARRQRT